jgi:hypothetical protein
VKPPPWIHTITGRGRKLKVAGVYTFPGDEPSWVVAKTRHALARPRGKNNIL